MSPLEKHNDSALGKMVEEIISRGYPELRGDDICVRYNTLDTNFMQVHFCGGNVFLIEVDHIFQEVSEKVLRGGLAHELSHIALEKNTGLATSLLYWTIKGFRKATERNADIETIIRGFGEEIHAFLEFIERNSTYKPEDGLSSLDVKALISPV